MKIERYKPPHQRRLENIWHHAMPTLTLAALTIISILPLPIPNYRFFTPDLSLLAIYYWCIYRRDLIPLPLCFAMGVFEDLFDGYQIGINAFIFSIVFLTTTTRARFFRKQKYQILWAGAAALCFLATLLEWVLREAFLTDHVTLTLQSFINAGLSGLLFPPLSILLSKIQKTAPVRVH